MRRKAGEEDTDGVSQRPKTVLLLQRRLIDIETAIDLDLQGMQPARGPAVVFGDETAGIRLVAGNRKAEILQQRDGRARQVGCGAGAVAVADDEIRTLA